MDIRVGDIQYLQIELEGADFKKVTRIKVKAINNNLELDFDNTRDIRKFSYDPENTEYDGIEVLIDKDKAWALTPGKLLIQIKLNYMGEDSDGKNADMHDVDNICTYTTAEVEFNVLPTLFKEGDVNER